MYLNMGISSIAQQCDSIILGAQQIKRKILACKEHTSQSSYKAQDITKYQKELLLYHAFQKKIQLLPLKAKTLGCILRVKLAVFLQCIL